MKGRPAYYPKLFLKIYLFGYFNGLLTCRNLEKKYGRNTELQWPTGNLHPNYYSIADLRKDNPKALKILLT
ncbi:MAG: transposase [Saprospiraceae bacterium]|nr:transposase [Saprospiraceae bacterium]